MPLPRIFTDCLLWPEFYLQKTAMSPEPFKSLYAGMTIVGVIFPNLGHFDLYSTPVDLLTRTVLERINWTENVSSTFSLGLRAQMKEKLKKGKKPGPCWHMPFLLFLATVAWTAVPVTPSLAWWMDTSKSPEPWAEIKLSPCFRQVCWLWFIYQSPGAKKSGLFLSGQSTKSFWKVNTWEEELEMIVWNKRWDFHSGN